MSLIVCLAFAWVLYWIFALKLVENRRLLVFQTSPGRRSFLAAAKRRCSLWVATGRFRRGDRIVFAAATSRLNILLSF